MAVANPTKFIRWVDETGDLPLADGSYGNPGADCCGEADAVVFCEPYGYLCTEGVVDVLTLENDYDRATALAAISRLQQEAQGR